MNEQKEDFQLREQNKAKPMIEDIIPEYLDGDNKNNALDFIDYLRENKMKPVWAIQNGWKAVYKGKPIYYIRLPKSKHHFLNKKQSDKTDWTRSWVVTPYLLHYRRYEDLIIGEGLQNFFWDNMRRCIHVITGECNSHNCAPGVDTTVLGKEFENLCHFVNSGANTLWYVNPDKTDICNIKKLLDIEIKTRSNL
ncbi:MAG: hypothetical protein LBI19_03050 [Oscillospiraceae bacterium]|jgi:hypothetical protein|nr:hypothetical protein [Oscillospiraceae bacterium]